LNGRKKKLAKENFFKCAESLGIETIVVDRFINKYVKLLPKFENMINNSFLNEELQRKFSELLKERLDRLILE